MLRTKKYGRRVLLGSAAGLALSTAISPVLAADPLVVVVNPNNRENLSRAELSAIFTTRKQAWSGGGRIVPFNFPAKQAFRMNFDEVILNMDADDVARYWIDRRIRGGNAPPKQVPSAGLIVRLVAKLEGAVAYVPRSTVNSTVRVLREV